MYSLLTLYLEPQVKNAGPVNNCKIVYALPLLLTVILAFIFVFLVSVYLLFLCNLAVFSEYILGQIRLQRTASGLQFA